MLRSEVLINERIDFEISLFEFEIENIKSERETLTDRIDELNFLNENHEEIVFELQDFLGRFGRFLSEDFKNQLQDQIAKEQDVLLKNTAEIIDSQKKIDDGNLDQPVFEKFVRDLCKLKKKSDETVFLVSVSNIEGENVMEISIDKDGNAKVSKIANAKGEPLARKVQWFTDGDDIATLTPSEDGLSCNVKGNGKAGSGSLFARVGKASDEDTELVESNHLPMLGIEKPDTAVAEFVIEEVLPA